MGLYRKYDVFDDYFDINKINNSQELEKRFYIAGLLAADGNVRDVKRGQNEISLTSIDMDIINFVRNEISPQKPIYEIDCSINSNKKIKGKNQFTIVFRSQKISDDIEKLFNIVPRKSLILTFPKNIIEHNSINHFIRGYFDGDGCLCIFDAGDKTLSANMTFNGTLDFLNGIKLVFENNIEVNKKIVPKLRKNKNDLQITYGGNKQVLRICEWLYNDFHICIDRKYEKYKQVIENRKIGEQNSKKRYSKIKML